MGADARPPIPHEKLMTILKPVTWRSVAIRSRVASSLIALSMIGCSGRAETDDAATTLRIGIGLGASARTTGLSVLTEMLYAEPLIALRADGRPEARLAETWRWENSHKRLRITLQKGTKLHDGRTLDAPLARKFLMHKVESLRGDGHEGAFDNVTSVITPDDHTLLLELREPDAFLIAEFNNAFLVDPNSPDVATGPFKLIAKSPVIAERFSTHHRGAPVIARVEVHSYDSQRAAWAALMRTEVDAVQEVNRDSVEFLERTPGVQIFGSLRPYYWALSFNLNHPQLRPASVRRAMSQAVNREEIVARVFRGFGQPAVDPVWPLFWAYPESQDRHAFDPVAARQLLEQTNRRRPGSPTLKFRCLFYGEDPQVERMALMIQRQLADIGVQLELEAAALNDMRRRILSGDYDSFLLQSASGRALDWTYRFWHSPKPGRSALQPTGYTGADDVLDDLRRSFTDEEVRAGVSKLRRRFYEDPPAVFVAWQQATRVVSNRFDISDVEPQDAFANIWRWKPAGVR